MEYGIHAEAPSTYNLHKFPAMPRLGGPDNVSDELRRQAEAYPSTGTMNISRILMLLAAAFILRNILFQVRKSSTGNRFGLELTTMFVGLSRAGDYILEAKRQVGGGDQFVRASDPFGSSTRGNIVQDADGPNGRRLGTPQTGSGASQSQNKHC